MNYRARLQKRIKLPSGFEATIRKLNAYNEPFVSGRRSRNEDPAVAAERGDKLSIFILTNKCVIHDGGSDLVIVDKPPQDCSPNEISISEVDNADIGFIVEQAIKFSGLDKAGEEAARTFPEGQDSGSECPPAGANVSRPPSNGAVALTN